MLPDELKTKIDAWRSAAILLHDFARDRQVAWAAGGGPRRDYDAFYDLAGRTSREVATLAAPELATKVADIEADVARYVERCEELGQSARGAFRDALAALGTLTGQRAARELADDPLSLLPVVCRRHIETAWALRRKHMDGRGRFVSYDPEGPITRAFFVEIAHTLGISTRAKPWPGIVLDALRQPVHGVVEGTEASIDRLSRFPGIQAHVSADHEQGKAGLEFRFLDGEELPDFLASVSAEKATLVQASVRDPRYRRKGADPESLEDLDDVELVGEIAHRRWAASRRSLDRGAITAYEAAVAEAVRRNQNPSP